MVADLLYLFIVLENVVSMALIVLQKCIFKYFRRRFVAWLSLDHFLSSGCIYLFASACVLFSVWGLGWRPFSGRRERIDQGRDAAYHGVWGVTFGVTATMKLRRL